MKFRRLFVTLLLSTTIWNCKNEKSADDNNEAPAETLFQLLSAEKTQIDFQNIVNEGLNTNVLMYEYFYNGGGVALGDVNGDGLDDAYFTSNMQLNQLYLNKGKMAFENITLQAGVGGREGPWKTGASMADVNGDGLLDIFVCYSGAMQPEKRKKQLFINQGNDANGIPKFIDKAEEYGLANTSTTTQAAFFDHDRDGDLDLLLLNHNIKSLPVLNILSTAEIMKTEDPVSGLRFFRQDQINGQPKFTDITKQAGIASTPLSYGLGIGIADVNQDGWQDMYISNDYTVPDYLYINNQRGGFKNQIDETLGHFSQFSMGNDIADVNNDALVDILTLDMLPEENRRQKLLMAPDNYEKFNFNVQVGFGRQFMRNMLHVASNNKTFAEIGQLAGVSNTDWSWSALLADYDNDGWKDLYITNGYLRDYTNLDFLKYMNDFTAQNQMNREAVMQLVQQMPSSNLTNYVFKNNGDLTFKNMVQSWGMNQNANSNGAAYSDLDNDGDLDLVVNNINSPAFVYENKASNNFLKLKLLGEGLNKHGLGAKITLFEGNKPQFQEKTPMHGYQSSVTNDVLFGLGKAIAVDSILIEWPSGKQEVLKNIKVNQTLSIAEKNAIKADFKPKFIQSTITEITSVNFTHQKDSINDFRRQALLTNPLSATGPCLAKGDANGDGLEDLYIGGSTNQAGQLFLQTKSGGFLAKPQAEFVADKASYDNDALFFDANVDGFQDIYVCSGGYGKYEATDAALQDRLYLNDGKGNFKKSPLPAMPTSTSCVRVHDANADGKPDLFVGGRVVVGSYPTVPTSYLLVNQGNGQFSIQTPAELKQVGMVTDAAWHDLDGDKQKELIIVGEWMPITVFRVNQNKFSDVTEQFFDKKYVGLWNKLLIDDLNADGNPDLVVGNLGTNSQLKASDEQPAELYFKDFDSNGSVEPILCSYVQGKSYPYLTRDELLEQLPMYRAKFTDYKSYAEASIADVFGEEDLKNAGHLKANCLKTMYFEGIKGNKFIEKPLPIQAQFAPVFGINALDVDADGKKDLILAGNIHNTRLKFGDYDANKGIVLKNTENGNFTFKQNLGLKGDVRSLIVINKQVIFGINQNKIRVFKIE